MFRNPVRARANFQRACRGAKLPLMSPTTRRLALILLLFLAVLETRTAVTAGIAASSTRAESMRAVRIELAAISRLVPDPAEGQAAFEWCATCHLAGGVGLPAGWVPRIAGQHPRVIAKELLDYRHHLRWDPRMELVAAPHILGSNQGIADVAAYAGALPLDPEQTGSGEDAAQGKVLYERLCIACHGPGGAGSNRGVIPRLCGQDHNYLLRQLHDALDGRRPSMAPVHARRLKGLDLTELGGLASYLSGLTQKGSTPDERSLTAQQ
jgi:cytochrome c553